MRSTIFGLSALALVAVSAPAFAQDASDLTISGGATVVSDYRFRGISQTDKRFALQGSITAKHSSGFYASVWGSSIDDYVAAGADTELDLVAGYSTPLGGATVDVGVVYYYYPGNGGADSDFFETYASVSGTVGGVSAKVGAAFAPKQAALTIGSGNEDNFYLYTDLSTALPGTPVTLTGHVGHSFGPSYLTIGDEYTDWSLGASYTAGNLTFGVSYVDTNKDLLLTSGRNISKAGVVASLGVAF